MAKRNYVLMTSKHSDKQHPLFWGMKTKDKESRSFAGYTPNAEEAEHYMLSEVADHYVDRQGSLFITLPIITDNVQFYLYEAREWRSSHDEDAVYITPLKTARELMA